MGCGVGLPFWLTQQLGPAAQEMLISTITGIVLVPLALPWGYVLRQYVQAPGDRWGKQVIVGAPEEPSSSPYQATPSTHS